MSSVARKTAKEGIIGLYSCGSAKAIILRICTVRGCRKMEDGACREIKGDDGGWWMDGWMEQQLLRSGLNGWMERRPGESKAEQQSEAKLRAMSGSGAHSRSTPGQVPGTLDLTVKLPRQFGEGREPVSHSVEAQQVKAASSSSAEPPLFSIALFSAAPFGSGASVHPSGRWATAKRRHGTSEMQYQLVL